MLLHKPITGMDNGMSFIELNWRKQYLNNKLQPLTGPNDSEPSAVSSGYVKEVINSDLRMRILIVLVMFLREKSKIY